MRSDETSISAFFEKDHAEIVDILSSVASSDSAAGLARLKEFDRRLERHIAWEEDVLFPSAGRAAPELKQGPIAAMRAEHVAIRARKKEALALLERGDLVAALEKVRQMRELLQAHTAKEDKIYPTCDRLLCGEKAKAVLEAIKASYTI